MPSNDADNGRFQWGLLLLLLSGMTLGAMAGFVAGVLMTGGLP